MVAARLIGISIANYACLNVPWKPIRQSGKNSAPPSDRKRKERKAERAQMKILNIESEMDYVAFLHDVVFSFEA